MVTVPVMVAGDGVLSASEDEGDRGGDGRWETGDGTSLASEDENAA